MHKDVLTHFFEIWPPSTKYNPQILLVNISPMNSWVGLAETNASTSRLPSSFDVCEVETEARGTARRKVPDQIKNQVVDPSECPSVRIAANLYHPIVKRGIRRKF